MRTIVLLPVLAACGGSGEWVVETWGEEYIEQEIPAEVFADGCSVVYDRFEVAVSDVALLDGDGEVAGSIAGARFEMTQPGPQAVGSVAVPATYYSTARFVVSADDGASVEVTGTLSCGGASKSFDWTFTTVTTYLCEPEDLTIPASGEAFTQLTIHGDHLFYDGLENPDALVRGQAIFDADADGDGTITQEELGSVSVATLGYAVGQYSEVTTLADFVSFLTQTLGHVDGEGHCQVDL
jgi:hypothetical protein